MQNLLESADQLAREFSRGGSSWLPAAIAGIVFLSAIWSIGKQVRAILAGK